MVVPGAAEATVVQQLRAESVEVGDLTLRDVPTLISGRELGDGIQGVLPLAIFSNFLMRLDIRAGELMLEPYPVERADAAGAIPAVASNQLLFVKATVNDAHEGRFLLDTGAAYNAISRNLARQIGASELMSGRVPLQSGMGQIDAPVLNGDVRLRVASKHVAAGPVVAVDLSTASRYHGMEISGLIGYPALCDSVLTVNYRDSIVRIESK
jgi:hypothetical protein